MNRVQVLTMILAFCTPTAAAETNAEQLLTQSKPVIQEQINQVLSAAKNHTTGDFRYNCAILQEVEKLKDSTENKSEIVQQIAISAAAPEADERQRLMAPMVLHLLHLQPKTVIPVLAPFLENDNEVIRSFARHWFKGHDTRETGVPSLQTVNYRDYLNYVRLQQRSGQEIPAAFIKYLYERSPERALLVFYYAAQQGDTIARVMELRKEHEAKIEERRKHGEDLPPLPPPTIPPGKILERLEEKPPKEILLAEHIIRNTIWLKKHSFNEQYAEALPATWKQIYYLARQDQWWARLYVAEIMRKHRYLRQTNILEKLSGDSNALVSKSAKRLLPENSR